MQDDWSQTQLLPPSVIVAAPPVPQVPINIQLEGLGATSEQSFDFASIPAMRRHRESIPLEDLQASGMFL